MHGRSIARNTGFVPLISGPAAQRTRTLDTLLKRLLLSQTQSEQLFS
jgi:hypothetical protein